jgi:excisionase family DNA binding protein
LKRRPTASTTLAMDRTSNSKVCPNLPRAKRAEAETELAASVAPRDRPVQLYDLETVAELTGLSTSTLRRAIRNRILACHRIGSRLIRISENDLQAYLSRHRKAAR